MILNRWPDNWNNNDINNYKISIQTHWSPKTRCPTQVTLFNSVTTAHHPLRGRGQSSAFTFKLSQHCWENTPRENTRGLSYRGIHDS